MKENLMNKKTIFGMKASEFIGTLILIVPIFISFKVFEISPSEIIPKLLNRSEKVSFAPTAPAAGYAAAFYIALILRYGFFKTDNVYEILVSSVRFILNIWVIASVIQMLIMPIHKTNTLILSNVEISPNSIIIFALIMTWLGIKTIAGYSWLLLVPFVIKRVNEINEIGPAGAIFVIIAALSLILQVTDMQNFKTFLQDFSYSAEKLGSSIKGNVNIAAEDAKGKVNSTVEFAKNYVGAQTFTATPIRSTAAGNVNVNLDALDLNKDGVIDEKDLELLKNDIKKI